MAVYIKPPVGTLSLSTIESCAKARLQFLLKVARCHGNSANMQDVVMDAESVKMADCLTEGSAKDVVSHFLLRLACSADPTLTSFFMDAEGAFFQYRVSRMTESELRTLVATPLRTLGKILLHHQGPLPPAMAQVAEMLGYMTYTYDLDTIVHYFVEGRKDKFLILRFEHVLGLVARRTVRVHRGKAIVPCTRLCDVLYVIFCKVLKHGMGLAKAEYPSVIEDDRFSRLFRQLKSMVYSQFHTLHAVPSTFGTVCADDVDLIQDCLPLCMSNLHRVLRQRHRLKHTDRIQYTLYLKELGMPVHEALQFWRLEYSQEVACLKGNNDQSWYRNSRRYTYNIRHLYGLEGARTNYRGHSCSTLQGRCLGPLEAGGCPFSNCDSAGLRNLLTDAGLQAEKQGIISDLASQHLPQHACQAYLGYKAAAALNIPECLGCDEGSSTKSGLTRPHMAKRKLKKDCSCGDSPQKKPCNEVGKSDANRLFPLKEKLEIKAECDELRLPSHEEYRYSEPVPERSRNSVEAKHFCKKSTSDDSCGTDDKYALSLQKVNSRCICNKTTLEPDGAKPFNHYGRNVENREVTPINCKQEMDGISCVKRIKLEPGAAAAANSTSDGQSSANSTSDGQNSANSTSDGQNSANSTSDGQSSANSTSDSQSTANSTSDGQSSANSTSGSQGLANSTSDGQGLANSTSDGQSSANSTSDGQSSANSTSDGESTANSTSDGPGSANSTSDGQSSACCLDAQPTESQDNCRKMHMEVQSCRTCGGRKTMQKGPVELIDRQSKGAMTSSNSTSAATSDHHSKLLTSCEQKMQCCMIQDSFTPTKPQSTDTSACSSSSGSSSTSQQVSLSPGVGARSSSGYCVSCSMKQKVGEVRFPKPVDYTLSYQKLMKGLRE